MMQPLCPWVLRCSGTAEAQADQELGLCDQKQQVLSTAQGLLGLSSRAGLGLGWGRLFGSAAAQPVGSGPSHLFG